MIKINNLEYFETVVKKNAGKAAVIDGDKSISFSKLALQSKLLANKIIGQIDCFNKPVAIFLPKSIECVVANFAITYSGNIYMNLDIKNPDARLKNIADKIQPALIITNKELEAKAKAMSSAKVLVIDLEELNATTVDDALIFSRLENIIDTDPYCIINTSGSTGTPKGVVLNHKSFVDFTEWAIDKLQIHDNEIIGSLSPIYFDIFSFELCLLMYKSATIIILSEQLAIFPAKLIELLIAKAVNFIFWVPTIMVNISNLDLLSAYQLTGLKKILFAGEVFPTKHLNYWRDKIPAGTFINLYGPIEITLDCTYYIVDKPLSNDTPIPIGYPCRNTDVLILNDEDKIAGVNEKGELCVRGTSLAMGYYNDPEKTAKAFAQNPLNKNYPEVIYRTGDVVFKNEAGEIIFTGRKDFQIKHLGYRIDLSEIEHVIVNSLGNIKNACVLYDSEKKEITLFYESASEISIPELRKNLLGYFPKYMIPSQFFPYKELPRNPNGKIDRNLLSKLLKDGAVS